MDKNAWMKTVQWSTSEFGFSICSTFLVEMTRWEEKLIVNEVESYVKEGLRYFYHRDIHENNRAKKHQFSTYIYTKYSSSFERKEMQVVSNKYNMIRAERFSS